MRVNGVRASRCSRLPGVGSVLVACALVALGTTACGGSKKPQAPAATGAGLSLGGTPAHRAALIRKRLTAAGFVVHAIPPTFRQNGLDVAPEPAIVPELAFTAVDTSLNPEWMRLHREIAAITAVTHRAALANKSLSHTTYERLLGISAQVTSLSLKERTVLLFDSPTEASLYSQRLDQQNLHRREILAESVVRPGNVQITRYRMDGPTIFVGRADTSSDATGEIKEVFDKQAFRRFVALAEGRA